MENLTFHLYFLPTQMSTSHLWTPNMWSGVVVRGGFILYVALFYSFMMYSLEKLMGDISVGGPMSFDILGK